MDDERAWQSIYQNYRRGVIDYRQTYLMLYAAYDRWCKLATGASTMSDALEKASTLQLQVWRYFFNDDTSSMVLHMRKLFILNSVTPLSVGGAPVVLNDAYDWRGLMRLWYAARCLIVHGQGECGMVEAMLPSVHATLSLFMARILKAQAEDGNKRNSEQIERPN